MTRTRLVVLGLAVVLGLGSVAISVQRQGQTAPAPQDMASPTPRETIPIDRSTEFPARIRVEAHGAAEFVWEGVETLTLNRIGYAGAEMSWLSVGMGITIPLPDQPQYRFRWAFDLFHQYQDQPGEFALGQTGGDGTPIGDMAFLVFMEVTEDAKDEHQVHDWEKVEFLKEFNELVQPCTVRIGETMGEGSVTCPALRSADGEEVSYTASWAQEPATPEASSG